MLFGKKSLRDVNFEDVRKLVLELKEPESVLLDYKSGIDPTKTNEDIAKDVSSFANHFGGYLIYGVAESSGVPTGFSNLNENPAVLRDKIIKVCSSPQWINPPIFLEDPHIVEGEENGRPVKVVITRIEESPAAPHHFKAGTTFYMRAGDTNQPVEGEPGVYAMLLNRREKMEKLRTERLAEARSFAANWLVSAFHPHSKEEGHHSFLVPHLSVCLQPRFFDMAAIESDTVSKALKEASVQLRKKFSWGPHSYDNFCESNHQESYASTIVYRSKDDSVQYTAAHPNVVWTSANRAGMIFHSEDMPFTAEGPSPDFKTKKTRFAFIPTIFLRRIAGFLFFAKEFYSICQRHFALDLIMECSNTKNILMMYHTRVDDQRLVIENQFQIKRTFTTYDLSDDFIRQLVAGDVGRELLLCINYAPGHTFDAIEYKSILEPFGQRA